MREIIVVPTYKREPLLWLCIEQIKKQIEIVPLCIFSDNGATSNELTACAAYFDVGLTIRDAHGRYGNSFNVIKSLEWAVGHAWPFVKMVTLVEDDTILHPGYFTWARMKLATGMYACALGRIPGDPAGTWYESPCVSWDAEKLRQCLELIPAGYLEARTREEMQKILDDCPTFKKSKYRFGSAEQDGFFLRCIEYFGWKTTFPNKSLASHLGTYGYNRPGGWEPTGTFEEKFEAYRKLLHDKNRRMEFFGQRITEIEMAGMDGLDA